MTGMQGRKEGVSRCEDGSSPHDDRLEFIGTPTRVLVITDIEDAIRTGRNLCNALEALDELLTFTGAMVEEARYVQLSRAIHPSQIDLSRSTPEPLNLVLCGIECDLEVSILLITRRTVDRYCTQRS
jgi:hypothetical protein